MSALDPANVTAIAGRSLARVKKCGLEFGKLGPLIFRKD